MNTQEKNMQLITHGCGNTLSLEKFQPVSNSQGFALKPIGGLWTSPIDSPYGWKIWGEDNEYGDFSTSFSCSFSGTVAVIDSLVDLLSMPNLKESYMSYQLNYNIDFAEVALRGIDAIHLTADGQNETIHSTPMNLYGWDCETVFIINPSSIQQLTPTKGIKA